MHHQQRSPAALEDLERRRAFRHRQSGLELLNRKRQLAFELGVGVLQPGRVKAHDAQRKGARDLELDAQIPRKVRAMDRDAAPFQLRHDAPAEPAEIVLEKRLDERRVATLPERLVQHAYVGIVSTLVVAVEHEVAQGLQFLRADKVVVSRHRDDKRLRAAGLAQPFEQRLEEASGRLELRGPAAVGQIAGDEQQVRRSQARRDRHLADAFLKILLDSPPQLGAPAAEVQVRDMQPADRSRLWHQSTSRISTRHFILHR